MPDVRKMRIATLNQYAKIMMRRSGSLQILGVCANVVPFDMCSTFREIEYL